MKPGFRTSELILTIVALLAGGAAAILPFFLDGDHAAIQGVGLVVSTLSAMGYGFQRQGLKKEELKAKAHVEAVKAASSSEAQDPLEK